MLTIPCQRTYKICIPNLDEKMPYINNGDMVYVWLGGTTDYEFEGCIIHSQIAKLSTNDNANGAGI